MREDLFGQQSDEEFSIESGLGAFVVVFGQMAEFSELRETFEEQLHLPAEAIIPEHPTAV